MNKLFTIATFAFAAATLLPSALPASAKSHASSMTMPTCASGDPVVWENSSSKVYHMQGDTYFGKTKKGAYACKSTADAGGYHLSGSTSSKSTSSMKSSSMKSSPMTSSSMAPASPAPGGLSASPNAGSVPTPAST